MTQTTPNPFSLVAELTYRCPLKCPYCSNPLHLRRYRDELDTESWKSVFAQAAGLGIIQVHFSGGEPLIRDDLPELIRAARDRNMYTHLSTSAVTNNESIFQELRDVGLDAIQISLQDTRPQENDWMAGTTSFEKKRKAVATIRELGFPITLNVVLHRHNLQRLPEVIDLACEWDVDKLELAHVQYIGWAYENRNALLPSREQVERAKEFVETTRERLGGRPEIVHVVPDYFQDYPKACLNGWGQVMLTVAPDGAVLPCQTAREIPGLEFPNIRDESLSEIWFQAPVFQRFRGTDWMPEPCRSCDRREIDFGGCRCQAFLLAGDPAVTDPVCHLSPHHSLVVQAIEESEQTSSELKYRVMSSRSGDDFATN